MSDDFREKLRHSQVVSMEGSLIVDLLRGAAIRFEPPLPADAEIVAVQNEWFGNRLQFKVCSWEWPRIADGVIPPDWAGHGISERKG